MLASAPFRRSFSGLRVSQLTSLIVSHSPRRAAKRTGDEHRLPHTHISVGHCPGSAVGGQGWRRLTRHQTPRRGRGSRRRRGSSSDRVVPTAAAGNRSGKRSGKWSAYKPGHGQHPTHHLLTTCGPAGLPHRRGSRRDRPNRTDCRVPARPPVRAHRRRTGLPVVRIGRSFRVPLARLEAWAGAPLGVDQLEPNSRRVTVCSSVAGDRTVDLRQSSPDAGNTSDRLNRRAGHGHGAAKETIHNQSQPRLPFTDEPVVALVESPTMDSNSGVGEQGTDGVDTLAPGVPQPRPARSRVQVGEPRC